MGKSWGSILRVSVSKRKLVALPMGLSSGLALLLASGGGLILLHKLEETDARGSSAP